MSTARLTAQIGQLADFAEVRGIATDAAGWRRLADALDSTGLDPFAPGGPDRIIRSALPPVLRRRLESLVDQGPELARSAALGALPWVLRRLIELDAADSRTAATLAAIGIATWPDLQAALDDGRVSRHVRAREDALRDACRALVGERVLVPLGRAVDLLESLGALVGTTCPQVAAVQAAGDARRFEPLVEWLAIAGAAPDPGTVFDALSLLPQVQPVRHATARRAVITYQGVEVDVRIAPPDEFGSALHAATGSHRHLTAMRGGQRTPRLWPREEDVYRHAGLVWIPPELRQTGNELDAARVGLPQLVDRRDIRGDLHMHTVYSDGRDSLSEMVQAAAALGYEYIAITDHSPRSFASRTLSLDSLARQRDEIAALRGRYPQLELLHGVEVDIMPDGRLDFADEVLESLDIVLASLHDRAGHDDARLTRRCLDAIRHPLVNVITHPANRMVGRDTGYDLAFAQVFEAAVETGTALEIDGAPGHLDLDGEQARAAAAAGVTLVVDSDCHRATLLDRQMTLGIGTARRGWIEPRHVLNTRPVEDVRAFVAAKRRGRG